MINGPMLVDPFGQADCEAELSKYGDRYEDLFFDEAPFNKPAIEPHSYLIVGRRGAGKTALSTFLSFQGSIPNCQYVELDARQIYKTIFHRDTSWVDQRRQLVIPELVVAWDLLVWSHIIEAVCGDIDSIKSDRRLHHFSPTAIFEKLARIIVSSDRQAVSFELEHIKSDTHLGNAKDEVCRRCARKPLIIAIDTLEQYDVSDNLLMFAQAALIEFASTFNALYSDRGLHLKVFIPGEVYPYLYQRVLLAPLKSVKHPVFLLWRARDLLRLISWRLYKRLDAAGYSFSQAQHRINWDSYQDVLNNMWTPFFGRQIENGNRQMEDSFPYVLRHTQMRPRQLIYLCNSIANRAIEAGRFPEGMALDVRDGVREGEDTLAQEILNSYSSVHENVDLIIRALDGSPMCFPGSELDRRAKRTKTYWPSGRYSLDEFRRLVAEIGIVGRVHHGSRDSRFISAEFEYSLPRHLSIGPEDNCVIHPMFFAYLNMRPQGVAVVIPFQGEE